MLVTRRGCLSLEALIVPPRQGPLRSAALTCGGERWLPVTGPRSLFLGVELFLSSFTTGATPMDLSIYSKDFTQHDLFGLFPGAPGGRALRDTYGRVYLVTIATKGGRTTLERYGKDYMRELASRGGKAKRHAALRCL
jgi:hypothetical protein